MIPVALEAGHISIHALHEEGDDSGLSYSAMISLFLSTPSTRRATTGMLNMSSSAQNFYPRPPRGGRHYIKIIVLED